MQHLHGPSGAECVTIATEQIESVRLAGPHVLNLPFDRSSYNPTSLFVLFGVKWKVDVDTRTSIDSQFSKSIAEREAHR
ncbi:unnamed protein product, partial [Brenthis ino]